MGHRVYQLQGSLKIKQRKLVPNLEIYLPNPTYSAKVKYEFDISTEVISALLLIGRIYKNGQGYGEDLRKNNGDDVCEYKSTLRCRKILRKKLIRVGKGTIQKGKEKQIFVFFHEQHFGLIDRWNYVNCIYKYIEDGHFDEDIYEYVKNCIKLPSAPGQPSSTGSSILVPYTNT